MRDHYREFSHPVLVDLPSEPTTDLFAEMDQVADELRRDPRHIEGDDKIAFGQVQRVRLPHLSKQEFLYLFAVWRDHYQAQQVIDEAERAARFDALCDERQVLFSVRASQPPEQQAAVTVRLMEIGPRACRASGSDLIILIVLARAV